MTIDHFGFGVADYDASKRFYEAALAPLGFKPLMEVSPEENGGIRACGFGRDRPDLWIGSDGRTTPKMHLAFRARTRAEVDAFHAATLAAGGRDNGGPGLRPNYGPNYYAAFAFDLDGHNIEAVCYEPG